MASSSHVRQALRRGLQGLLRPVIYYCLRRSFRIRDLLESAKIVFVSCAEAELKRRSEPVTASKISAMTGIQRRDFMRLAQGPEGEKSDLDLVTRVIGQWQSDKRFKSAGGGGRVLTFKGGKGDFAELVSSVSSDLNPYTVLFELERAGTAEQTERGVKLLKASYRPVGDIRQQLDLLSDDSLAFMQSVDENIFAEPEQLNLHIRTSYDNIPLSRMNEVRLWFLSEGAEFHKKARDYLSSLDRDIGSAPEDDEPGRGRATLVAFSFTEEIDAEDE